MADQFTPGPWAAGWGDGLTGPTTPAVSAFCGGREWEFMPVSKGMEIIAVCPAQDVHAGSHEANARLIAEAPAMLEALREILSIEVTAPEGGHEEVLEIHGIARAAIRRATGEAE